jgi:hypothetical protein
MAKDSILSRMMREVHHKIPSTVPARMKGKKKEKMLEAIAFSKARKAGAHV